MDKLIELFSFLYFSHITHHKSTIVMTYKEIQILYKKQFNKSLKTCFIADVRRELGLTNRIAFNRINLDSVKYPCTNEEIRQWLISILKNK